MNRLFYAALRIVIPVFLILGLSSCGKEESSSNIPYVNVSFVINPNSTEYLELNYVTGWVYLTGGYHGILVYRLTMDQFMAYDRACPYDYELTEARVDVDEGGLTCTCPACGSMYNILDGTPLEGPCHQPLKQYQASYDSYTGLLYVYN